MRLTRIVSLALVSLSLFSAAAYAQSRRPHEFQAPREMSEAEIAAAKERSRAGSDINRWGKDTTGEVAGPPWMAIGLMVLVFVVAAPFALRAYQNTASEIRERSGASAPNAPARSPPPARRSPPRPPDA